MVSCSLSVEDLFFVVLSVITVISSEILPSPSEVGRDDDTFSPSEVGVMVMGVVGVDESSVGDGRSLPKILTSSNKFFHCCGLKEWKHW